MRPPASRDDSGTSLPELLITMVLTTILLALTGTVFVSTMRTVATTKAKQSQVLDARVALEALTLRLRVAIAPVPGSPAFTTAEPSQVTFYASLQNGSTAESAPTKVDFRIDTARQCLLQTMTPASGVPGSFTWPDAGSRSSCIAFGAITSRSTLFTYFPKGSAGVVTPLGAAGTVSATDLSRIGSVAIDLTIQAGDAARPTSVGSRVTLPNTGGT
jgi:type II secretory pathway pseudopilin PulG